MSYNKVVYDGKVLVDLTSDTVTPDTLFEGHTAHGKDGSAVTGTFTIDVELAEQQELIDMITAALENKSAPSAGSTVAVVGGTTQPASPAENTIWVNTDSAINGYTFAPKAPSNAVEGMVWVKIASASNVSINVNNDNAIILHPVACYQYLSGSWISKTAKAYVASSWKQLGLILYNTGDTDTGLISKGWKYSSGASGVLVPTVSYAADGMSVYIANGKGGHSGAAYFPDKYDLTAFSTLTAEVFISGNLNSYAPNNINGIFVWKNLDGNNFVSDAVASSYPKATGSFTLSVDVTELSGEYYIGFGLRYESSTITIKAHDVRLE